MPFIHEASGTGTDQELLDIARASLARVMSSGRRYRVGDREVELPTIDELRKIISDLESKIAATSSVPTFNYARYVREI